MPAGGFSQKIDTVITPQVRLHLGRAVIGVVQRAGSTAKPVQGSGVLFAGGSITHPFAGAMLCLLFLLAEKEPHQKPKVFFQSDSKYVLSVVCTCCTCAIWRWMYSSFILCISYC